MGSYNLSSILSSVLFTGEHSIDLLKAGQIMTTLKLNDTVIAGKTGVSGFADGPFDQARFSYPTAISVLSDSKQQTSTIFVADTNNNAIRVLDMYSQEVRSICTGRYGENSGPPSLCQLKHPTSLLTTKNFLYVGGVDMIRKIPMSVGK